MDQTPRILTNTDRDFFQQHYTAIAERLKDHRIWRNRWTVEVDGCIYKFQVTGYAKKGTAIWNEQQAEQQPTESNQK